MLLLFLFISHRSGIKKATVSSIDQNLPENSVLGPSRKQFYGKETYMLSAATWIAKSTEGVLPTPKEEPECARVIHPKPWR